VRIAYFGLPLAALLLLEDGHELECAVISRPDGVGLRRLVRQLGGDRVYLRAQTDLGLEPLAKRVRNASVELVVSWFWTTRLPLAVVDAARLGGIGVHPSLLPRHRGPDPYFAAIDQGDRVTGVTVHRISEEYDTGAILASEPMIVDDRWNAWQLARHLDRPSLRLLRAVVSRIGSGERMTEVAQDEHFATWAPSPSSSDCALVWAWSSARILRRIRALAPAPGAFTEIHGKILTLLRAELAQSFPRALEAGEAAVTAAGAVVRTGDSAIRLLEGECEGTRLDWHALAGFVARGGDLG
jgi:methionyl-tRNA formyltransferase